MRFLADENFPSVAFIALRANGRDVVGVLTDAPSTDDRGVLAWTTRENRILRTFDKDFSELAVDPSLPVTGAILLRTPLGKPSELARDGWPGHFCVIEPSHVRMRRLGA